MAKLLGLSVAAILAFVLQRVFKARAKKRLAAIDRGELCMVCGATTVTVNDERAECDACGDVRDLASVRDESFSDADLERIFTPERRGFWD